MGVVQPTVQRVSLKEGSKPQYHYKYVKTKTKLDEIKRLKGKYGAALPNGKFSLKEQIQFVDGQNGVQENEQNQLIFFDKDRAE